MVPKVWCEETWAVHSIMSPIQEQRDTCWCSICLLPAPPMERHFPKSELAFPLRLKISRSIFVVTPRDVLIDILNIVQMTVKTGYYPQQIRSSRSFMQWTICIKQAPRVYSDTICSVLFLMPVLISSWVNMKELKLLWWRYKESA